MKSQLQLPAAARLLMLAFHTDGAASTCEVTQLKLNFNLTFLCSNLILVGYSGFIHVLNSFPYIVYLHQTFLNQRDAEQNELNTNI